MKSQEDGLFVVWFAVLIIMIWKEEFLSTVFSSHGKKMCIELFLKFRKYILK